MLTISTPLSGSVWPVCSPTRKSSRELERVRADDPTADDLANVDRLLADLAKQLRTLVANLALVEDVAAAAVADRLREMAALEGRLRAERETILARHGVWAQVGDRIDEIQRWCGHVAARLGSLTFQERRLALEALGVEVRVWQRDHDPRWEVRANLPLEPTEPIVSRIPSTRRTASRWFP
jgi:site-specific DNA recombinase